jgi:hypothetical protein
METTTLRDSVPTTAFLIALATVAALAAPLRAAKGFTEIPLEWRPTITRLDLKVPEIDHAPFARVRIRVDTFADARGVAAGTLGETSAAGGASVPLSTPDDLPAFVTDEFLALLRDFDLPVIDDRQLRAMGADVVDKNATIVQVKGSIATFSVTVGKALDAEVRLDVTLVDARGQDLWKGSSSGKAGRLGRSYKLRDAQEALSEALQEAIAQLLRTPDFLHALAGLR